MRAEDVESVDESLFARHEQRQNVPPRRQGLGPVERRDPLYGAVRVAGWAALLIETPPFQRLAQVSLSDVPGALLFHHGFPSRLEHALGVYHIARLARPHDRALQVAALAHDLGHGPFSHLSEALMRERLGVDHEQRSAHVLLRVRAALPPAAARALASLDWDEVAQLVLGGGADGRGALLNGRLDYDNLDNVARFLWAAGLGTPQFDPRQVARALHVRAGTRRVGVTPASTPGSPPGAPIVYLDAAVEAAVRGWLDDRARVYAYLHDGHRNLAAHAMLRKAIDLAAEARALPVNFFDLTDAEAMTLLRQTAAGGAAALAGDVSVGRLYHCVWEGQASAGSSGALALPPAWRERLGLEAALAGDAGLSGHAVVVEALVSSARRELPPFAVEGQPGTFYTLPSGPPAACKVHVFMPTAMGRDYARRLRASAERRLGALGVLPITHADAPPQ